MFQFSGRGLGRKSAGTVTVIETRVHRAWARKARVGFVVTALVVGVLTASILSDRMHPILALLVGVLAGLVCGAGVWALIRVWPVLRLLWWWLPEILTGFVVVYGWAALAHYTVLVVRLLVLAALVAVVAAVRPVRRRLAALAWCVIVRHRLRTCFAQFIVANRYGSLPLIGVARPTPVGERVWIYLRPGLSLADLEARLDKLAVACHASSVIVERASSRTAALLRVDVKRREVLSATIGSPLPGLVDPGAPSIPFRSTVTVSGGLDLPDVTTSAKAAGKPAAEPVKPSPRKEAAATAAAAAGPVAASVNGEDVTDWID